MKRLLDIGMSATSLIILFPVLLMSMLLIWLQDFQSPFYFAPRVGRNKKIFHMVKFRSMVVGADRTGVASTASDDKRITRVGHMIRTFKIDELPQLWNVLKGEMSIVGPRPNLKWATDVYTAEESRLLTVLPGITDPASIVFSDEGSILKGSSNPDAEYDRIIRPWKSRLGLVYVDNTSLRLDIETIFLTALALISKPLALKGVGKILDRYGADPKLKRTATRQEPLSPFPLPGSDETALAKDLNSF